LIAQDEYAKTIDITGRHILIRKYLENNNTARPTNWIVLILSCMVIAAFCLAAGCSLQIAEKDPLRIMPLGDSITAGYTDNSKWAHPFEFGYRSGLYRRLKNAGHDFVFVGDSKEPFDNKYGDPTHGGTVSPKLDLRKLNQDGHRGYGGWGTNSIQKNVAEWIKQDRPDIILLLIGINGINPRSPEQLDGLVKTIYDTDKNVKLVVAQITPLKSFNQNLFDYNTYIRESLLPAYASKGYAISTVDLYKHFLTNPNDPKSIDPTRLSNRINHPTNALYDKMAESWFQGIKNFKKPRSSPTAESSGKLPNIIYILADDMGYGDVSALNDESKIQTPNIDRLANEGMRFTDAHSGSAVCTPTRYGILTGRYCWRSRLKKGVLGGYSEPLIEDGRMTVATLLKQSGYNTACVGKWHLGMDMPTTDGKTPGPENTDWKGTIKNGPTAKGFDYFFGISASLDMDPYVYIENDRLTAVPDRIVEESASPAFWREGPIAPDFEFIEVLPTLTDKATDYIDQQAKEGNPFFLYFPLPAPHTPIVPTPKFQGKSGLNPYADFVIQTDHTVGRILKALDRNKLTDNTLVIFTTDNGCSPQAKFPELEAQGHFPSYVFRGHKADIFEGGHRIPFVVRWPLRIKPAGKSDETICLTDLMATCAAIAGKKLGPDAGEDSYNLLPAMLGEKSKKPIREATVHHSINGSFSIRQGKWKLELCPGSGGWSDPKPKKAKSMGLPSVQLYDLENDIGEKTNVQDKHPEIVKQLTALMEKYKSQDRSVQR